MAMRFSPGSTRIQWADDDPQQIAQHRERVEAWQEQQTSSLPVIGLMLADGLVHVQGSRFEPMTPEEFKRTYPGGQIIELEPMVREWRWF